MCLDLSFKDGGKGFQRDKFWSFLYAVLKVWNWRIQWIPIGCVYEQLKIRMREVKVWYQFMHMFLCEILCKFLRELTKTKSCAAKIKTHTLPQPHSHLYMIEVKSITFDISNTFVLSPVLNLFLNFELSYVSCLFLHITKKTIDITNKNKNTLLTIRIKNK